MTRIQLFHAVLISALLPLATAARAQEPCATTKPEARAINAAKLFVENNAGDGDLGVHGYFDDETWQELCVFDPSGTLILHVEPQGRMADLGISGIFFESREPEYAEWNYDDLKAAWPEGQYSLRAVNNDGSLLNGAALFTTVVPSMPEIVTPASVPEPEGADLPVVAVADLPVQWKPVTTSLDGRPVRIVAYQVTVEKHNHEDRNGFSRPTFNVHVGPDRDRIVVPATIFDAASVYEIEVLAIEESGNQTIGGASFFATE